MCRWNVISDCYTEQKVKKLDATCKLCNISDPVHKVIMYRLNLELIMNRVNYD